MQITEIMTRDVRFCRGSDTLACAARLMWDHDIGSVPVVDDETRVIGMITDRDVCMAAYTTGRPLDELIVGNVMSKRVVTCDEHAADAELARAMVDGQVRRVPVVDGQRHLVGIVTLSDLALAPRRGRPVPSSEIVETLAAVSQPRHHASTRA